MLLRSLLLVFFSFSAYANDAWVQNQLCDRFDQVMIDSRFAAPHEVSLIKKTYREARKKQAHAQAELGDRYIDGQSVPKDWRKGFCWYRAAAGNGSAYAQYWLGIFYQNGYIVDESADMSAFWFRRANAQANSTFAQSLIGDRYANDASGVHDLGQAIFWYQRAANKGNLNAELALGNFYIDSHEPSDMQLALNWYRKAASQHSIAAAYNIGQIYYRGQAIHKDNVEAHKWFLQAAEAGYAPAQYNLADMYYRGLGVKKDWITAYAWLVTSNAANNNPAAKNLQNKLTEEFTPEQLNKAVLLAADYKRRYSST